MIRKLLLNHADEIFYYAKNNIKILHKSFNKNTRLFWANPNADIKPDLAYHGSSFNFDMFDIAKIGSGEGCGIFGKGIYLHRTKKVAPYYANIRSFNAPQRILRSTSKIANTEPTVYTTSGLKDLNLKYVSTREGRKIARRQAEFEIEYPQIDGLEFPSGQITVFPKSVSKLKIDKKQPLYDFLQENKGYPFNPWTIDENELKQFLS